MIREDDQIYYPALFRKVNEEELDEFKVSLEKKGFQGLWVNVYSGIQKNMSDYLYLTRRGNTFLLPDELSHHGIRLFPFTAYQDLPRNSDSKYVGLEFLIDHSTNEGFHVKTFSITNSFEGGIGGTAVVEMKYPVLSIPNLKDIRLILSMVEKLRIRNNVNYLTKKYSWDGKRFKRQLSKRP